MELDDNPCFFRGTIFQDNNGTVTNLVTFVTFLGANHIQFGGEMILSHTFVSYHESYHIRFFYI